MRFIFAKEIIKTVAKTIIKTLAKVQQTTDNNKRMETTCVKLTNEQVSILDDMLYGIACECDLREDDNVQESECEVEIDGTTWVVEYRISCAWERAYSRRTWDNPEEGGSEIDVDVMRMYAYDEDDNEIEAELENSTFEYIFKY